MARQDIVFEANGEKLAGWLYRAEGGGGRQPLIVLSHGFSAVMAMGLQDYAEAFAAAGYACLVYDHRNYGQSSGWPRNETDPWAQVEDMRAAISHARTLDCCDPDRVGLWGTSYAGGHVLTVGALDKRVACLVSQVPLVSGQRTFDAWVPAGTSASCSGWVRTAMPGPGANRRPRPPPRCRVRRPRNGRGPATAMASTTISSHCAAWICSAAMSPFSSCRGSRRRRC